MNNASLSSFLWRALSPFKWLITTKIFFAMLWAFDLSLRPFLLKIMLDRMGCFASSNAYSILIFPVVSYILLHVIMIIVFRLDTILWSALRTSLREHIGHVLMDRMLLHAHAFFQSNFSGSLGNRISEVMRNVPDLLKEGINHFISIFLAASIAFITLGYVHFYFALFLLIWVTVFCILALFFAKEMRALSDETASKRAATVGVIVDMLGNIMSIRLFTGRRVEKNLFARSLQDFTRVERVRDFSLMKVQLLQGASFVLYEIACLGWLVFCFGRGLVTLGDFALVLSINISLVDQIWHLSRDIDSFSEYIGSITESLSIIFSPISVVDKPHALPLVIKKGAIVFDAVKFSYEDAEPLFERKSVKIPAGQKVGLVGYSGSGKTTFINLILRLFDVTDGRILIDDQDISEITQDSLRSIIGIIPQDPSLFHRTIRENIRYGKIDATDEEVIEAAKKASAHNFIQLLPEGYDTEVGERGVKLSGGQRQRIALARAVLKNAPILIFDEATSQLDSITEAEIQDALWDFMEGKTTLVIAHRLSTLLSMDRILVFDKGKIVADGTHAELLAKEGLYKTLWEAQVGGFLPDDNALVKS